MWNQSAGKEATLNLYGHRMKRYHVFRSCRSISALRIGRPFHLNVHWCQRVLSFFTSEQLEFEATFDEAELGVRLEMEPTL